VSAGPALATAARGRRAPLLLVTAAALVAAVAVVPLVYLLLRGVSADAEARRFVPFDTTVDLVLDTALLAVGVVLAATAVGLPLAWLVVRTDLPGRRAWGVLASLPLVIPSFVAALALLGAFGPRGMLQRALSPLGVDRLPDVTGYWGALLALTLSTYPYVFLLVAASLRSIDTAAEEAARGLGAGRLAVLARVTIPSLRPTLAASSLLVALYVLSDFGAVSLMGYSTLTTSIYVRYESLLDRDAAAILALVLVALAGLVVLLASRWRLRGAAHRSTPGAGRAAHVVALGRWRWAATAFAAAATGLFLVLPLGVLCWWTVHALPETDPLDLAWDAAVDSLTVSAIAAGVAAIVTLPAAVLAWRYPSRLARGLERLTLLPTAVPGIAVGLALVYFGARVDVLYGTLALLVLAYLVRFMPYALASSRAALDAVSPRLEDASRSLGSGPAGTLGRVVLPLARPGILAGAALVFLSTIKELPATLLLRPIGFETLATEIWKETSVSAYGAAAPSALLLVVIAAPLVYLLSWRSAWELGSPG
jgi:iron(III) transport system permease protein